MIGKREARETQVFAEVTTAIESLDDAMRQQLLAALRADIARQTQPGKRHDEYSGSPLAKRR